VVVEFSLALDTDEMMRVRKEESRSRCGRIWLIFKLRLNISHNRAFGLDIFFLRFLSTHQLLAVQLRGATRSRYHPCVTRFLTTNSSRFNCEEQLKALALAITHALDGFFPLTPRGSTARSTSSSRPILHPVPTSYRLTGDPAAGLRTTSC
jgi:hypothetical protein